MAYRTKAMVIAITCPVVAHAEGTWYVQVVYGVKQNNGYVKKNKRWIFANTRYEIGQWIEVNLL